MYWQTNQIKQRYLSFCVKYKEHWWIFCSLNQWWWWCTRFGSFQWRCASSEFSKRRAAQEYHVFRLWAKNTKLIKYELIGRNCICYGWRSLYLLCQIKTETKVNQGFGNWMNTLYMNSTESTNLSHINRFLYRPYN